MNHSNSTHPIIQQDQNLRLVLREDLVFHTRHELAHIRAHNVAITLSTVYRTHQEAVNVTGLIGTLAREQPVSGVAHEYNSVSNEGPTDEPVTPRRQSLTTGPNTLARGQSCHCPQGSRELHRHHIVSPKTQPSGFKCCRIKLRRSAPCHNQVSTRNHHEALHRARTNVMNWAELAGS
jgi:hypothetical protein